MSRSRQIKLCVPVEVTEFESSIVLYHVLRNLYIVCNIGVRVRGNRNRAEQHKPERTLVLPTMNDDTLMKIVKIGQCLGHIQRPFKFCCGS